MSNNNQRYTQEQMDIALLKNTTEGIFREFKHIDYSITSFKSDIRDQISEIKTEIKSQFNLVVSLMLGIYGLIGAAALGKIFGIL